MADGIRERNCAFVMLDVLGFKNKLNGPSRVEEFQRFVEVVEQLKRAFDSKATGDIGDLLKRRDERALLYSDTLIYWQDLASDMTAPDTLVSAAAFAMRTICAGLESGFMLRGAIAFGELLTCDNPEALGGPVVNECAQHYELGNWCGCHLTPSAVKVLDSTPAERKARTGPRFAKYRMPVVTKTNEIFFSEQWAVRWLDYQAEMLPRHAQYLFEGELKFRIHKARERREDERRAVKEYFVGFLKRYEQANPVAKGKVAATILAVAPEFV
jgi:hypothetical protein